MTVTADLGPAPALGDPRLAERLVANLADNAIRYNGPGGLVEITAGRRDDRAFLAVTNTGPVIPPDQLGRLFQPFQRLAEGRRAELRQTGLRQTGPGPYWAGPYWAGRYWAGPYGQSHTGQGGPTRAGSASGWPSSARSRPRTAPRCTR